MVVEQQSGDEGTDVEETNSVKKDKRTHSKVSSSFSTNSTNIVVVHLVKNSVIHEVHHDDRIDNNVLRLLADSPACQNFDMQNAFLVLTHRIFELGCQERDSTRLEL